MILPGDVSSGDRSQLFESNFSKVCACLGYKEPHKRPPLRLIESGLNLVGSD